MIGSTYSELKLLKNPFQKFSIHYYNNKGTKKFRGFQKLSNKEICFIIQSNSSKYNKTFKFISWPDFLQGQFILSPEILGKTLPRHENFLK